jgi:hypothetical protein
VIKHAIHTVDEKMGTIQYEMPNMTADFRGSLSHRAKRSHFSAESRGVG